MTPEQLLHELKKEFMLSDRINRLLREYADQYVVDRLRKTKNITDHLALVKLTGEAHAISAFVDTFTRKEDDNA